VAHGAAAYAPDQAGFGMSEGDRALVSDYEAVVCDIQAVVARARADHPETPVVLIGHSVGGMIATRYAQRFPDDLAALVLAAPVLGDWATARSLLAFGEIPEVNMDIGAMMSRDDAEGTRYNEDLLVFHGTFKRPTLEAVVRCLDTINVSGSLLSLPTLWLHGDADYLAPMPDARTGIQKVQGAFLTEKIYPGAMHALFHEVNKDEVIGDITAFIDGVLAVLEAERDH
jgi:alpha-beta hydrolase superfamily lysophospholipase